MFFFKQKTAYEMRISDWSSDVCSSDLLARKARIADQGKGGERAEHGADRSAEDGNPGGHPYCVHQSLVRPHLPVPVKRKAAPYRDQADRKSFVPGTILSVSVTFGGRRYINKNKQTNKKKCLFLT